MYVVGSTSSSYITGMTSGLDVDKLVADLMQAEIMPLDNAYQEKQLAEWTMDAYREVTMELKAFEDTYFNYLNSSSNMLSQSTYITFDTNLSDEDVLTAYVGAEAVGGSYSLEVFNVATAATLESSSGVSNDIEGTSPPDFNAAQGGNFEMIIDGVIKTIDITSSINDIASLQNAIDETFGSNKVEVCLTNGALTFSTVDSSGVHNITLSSTSSNALADLGFGNGSNLTNRIDPSDTLEEVASSMNNSFAFDSNDELFLTINDVSFNFSKDITLNHMMEEINNNPDTGVHMSYNEFSDEFVFTATQTGAGNNIVITESGSTFLASADITDYTAGEDAVVILDGEKLTRSSNTITAEGVTFTVVEETTEPVNISVTMDSDAVYDNILNFINAYNNLIESLNETVSEEYDRDYPPLTQAQKDEITEEEIELWEEKAQTGLLSNDSIIENILSDMRTALYTPIEGVYITLVDIGITTGSYDENGILHIDEEKLMESIQEDPQAVSSLFCQESSSYPGTTTVRDLNSDEREVRYEEEGLAYRLFDIIQDNISTYKDENGQKGILLEKVGMPGDSSEFHNLLYNQIEDYEDEIDSLEDKMVEKETFYYNQFSAMEVYIERMNAQLEAIAGWFE